MIGTREGGRLREIGISRLTVGLVASLALAGCGGDGATRKWSIPGRVVPAPRFMTAKACEDNFWEDRAGKRQPTVQQKPLIVRVDGRCNTPLHSEEVGVYPSPAQVGQPAFTEVNGDALGVECSIPGEPIQDIRGPSSSSTVWYRVIDAAGRTGDIPATNVGYPNTSDIGQC